MMTLGSSLTRHVLGVAILALLATAGAAAQTATPSQITPDPTLTDEFRQEIEAQGVFLEALDFWRVDDGSTVSALWRFTTPQRDHIPPAIEVPSPGDYPWYTGSEVNIVDPTAYWTGGGWVINGGGAALDGDPDAADQDPEEPPPAITVRDTNPPQEDAVKKVTLAYWWRRPGGGTAPPGPSGGFDTPGTWRNWRIESWPSHLHPGSEFVIFSAEVGPPCPATVAGSVRATSGSYEILGPVLTGHCEAQ